jgi:hypothetical protein
VGLLNTNTYFACFGSNQKEVSRKYVDLASDADYERFSNLGGDVTDVDTPLELALLSYYSQPLLNVRPVEAQRELPANNPRVAGLKLGSAVLKELAELKFLDPSNTAAIGRYEGMITFISDRNGVSRAEMQGYLRQGIAGVVREKFNKIDFGLEHNQTYYNVTLSRNPKNGEFVLSYDRNRRTVSGRDLNELLATMGRNRDFGTRDIEQTRSQVEYIPAVVYGSWLDKKMTTVDAVQLAADTIANFYISPTSANYDLLVGVFGLFNRSRGVEDPVAEAGHRAFRSTLNELNKSISDKAYGESSVRGVALARAAQARNPDYSVFTITSR